MFSLTKIYKDYMHAKLIMVEEIVKDAYKHFKDVLSKPKENLIVSEVQKAINSNDPKMYLYAANVYLHERNESKFMEALAKAAEAYANASKQGAEQLKVLAMYPMQTYELALSDISRVATKKLEGSRERTKTLLDLLRENSRI